jgi:hypothetical protein
MRRTMCLFVAALSAQAACFEEIGTETEVETETAAAPLAIPGWRYAIVNTHSGMCLGPENNQLFDGNYVNQYTCNGNLNQVWLAEEVSPLSSEIRFKNVANQTLCLGIQSGDTWARVLSCSNAGTALFPNVLESSNFGEVLMPGSGFNCLDVFDASMISGGWAQSYPCNVNRDWPSATTTLSSNQLWVLSPR